MRSLTEGEQLAAAFKEASDVDTAAMTGIRYFQRRLAADEKKQARSWLSGRRTRISRLAGFIESSEQRTVEGAVQEAYLLADETYKPLRVELWEGKSTVTRDEIRKSQTYKDIGAELRYRVELDDPTNWGELNGSFERISSEVLRGWTTRNQAFHDVLSLIASCSTEITLRAFEQERSKAFLNQMTHFDKEMHEEETTYSVHDLVKLRRAALNLMLTWDLAKYRARPSSVSQAEDTQAAGSKLPEDGLEG